MVVFHVGIIMDGNGRWAGERGLPRTVGHRAGADAVRRTVEAAAGLAITDLTLYAFSANNWRRPDGEVAYLMVLFHRYLIRERDRCRANGIRVSVVGRRDRIPPRLVGAIERSEIDTASAQRLHLRLAVDYSSRDAIRRGELLPDVDLLVRTGRERRLSDFLLWESAYAELHFTDCMWPDFGGHELRSALQEFHRRDRRFGAVIDQVAHAG